MEKRFYKVIISLPSENTPRQCVIIIDYNGFETDEELTEYFSDLIQTYHENHVDTASYSPDGFEYEYKGNWEEIDEGHFYELIDEGYEDLTESDVEY